MLNVIYKNQSGFSLIEFMIGSVVGLIVLFGVLTMYNVSVRASSNNLDASSLNQELRASIRMMVDDIRRAGFWAGVPGLDDMTENPFQDNGNDLTVATFEEVPNACITYTYDLDKDKSVGDGTGGAAMEALGFRYIDGRIQTRIGGNGFSCTSGTWQTLTSNNIEITQLNFNIIETCANLDSEVITCPCDSGDPCQHIRQVDITISGQVTRDDQIQGTITESVRVRNDKFVASAP